MEKLKVTLLYDVIEDTEKVPGADPPVYREVATALKRRGHEIKTIAAEPNLRNLVAQVEKDDSDVIFNLCESLGGVDEHAIRVASLLELLGKRFTGTGAFGMTLAQDKAVAKKLFNFHGIGYPRFSMMEAGKVEWSDELQFPLFVKPSNTDSSVGIDAGALVHNIKELMERISYIHTEFKAPVLIEEFIEGRELFVGVVGPELEALPIIEWDFANVRNGPKFATAEAKWDKNSEGYKAPERFPTDIPAANYQRIQQTALEACRALKVLDYGRVDMRVRRRAGSDDEWECFVIEVNPNPYLEQHSEVAMAAKQHGLKFPDLLERILESALRRQR